MILSKLVLGAQSRNQKKREQHLTNKLQGSLNRNFVRVDELDNSLLSYKLL